MGLAAGLVTELAQGISKWQQVRVVLAPFEVHSPEAAAEPATRWKESLWTQCVLRENASDADACKSEQRFCEMRCDAESFSIATLYVFA